MKLIEKKFNSRKLIENLKKNGIEGNSFKNLKINN